MAELITFFSGTEDGPDKRLVGIGLTDEMIAALKKSGVILEEGKRTGSGVDVLLIYSPTLNELVKKIKTLTGPNKTKVRLI